MEFFSEDPTELGCSLVFVQDVLSSLSENVKTIIDIKDVNSGQLVLERGELQEKPFRLDHFPEQFDKESLVRRLAPLNHLQNLKSSIPESVTFLEMYGVERFEDLQVTARWKAHAPYKSLAVPLGLRGQDDIVSLNLHEKAHGPHGLVAGTTGSGKSEIIQSYILSLAVNFHPHDVAFLLIDYKGGGMANLFKDLPHLLGTITNLDGAQSMRALVSINAELKRRQRLFAKHDVNHINQYQKKYRLGEAEEPMPHLFLISDEFAELKANQPDFMSSFTGSFPSRNTSDMSWASATSDAWNQRQDEKEQEQVNYAIAQVEEAHKQGALSDSDYNSIKSGLLNGGISFLNEILKGKITDEVVEKISQKALDWLSQSFYNMNLAPAVQYASGGIATTSMMVSPTFVKFLGAASRYAAPVIGGVLDYGLQVASGEDSGDAAVKATAHTVIAAGAAAVGKTAGAAATAGLVASGVGAPVAPIVGGVVDFAVTSVISVGGSWVFDTVYDNRDEIIETVSNGIEDIGNAISSTLSDLGTALGW